mmetsp:Transcript_2525/g.4277  ORF Transcript_2525/g.4277 Transcript_2525/m.4277 type:complete len:234 (-) Transcript_2525:96-797(-)
MPTKHVVPSPAGDLVVHEWHSDAPMFTILTVHPWAALGGGEHNCVGLARELARASFRVLTFQMLPGSAIWGLLSAHRREVTQVVAVGQWARQRFGLPLVLLGSSAGAPIAGSALEQLGDVAAFVAIGYTWGSFAALGFGRHFAPTRKSPIPKLFIMGEHDEFSSPQTLQRAVEKMNGPINDKIVVQSVGHFELEQSNWDEYVSNATLGWLQKRLVVDTAPATVPESAATNNAL